MTDKVQKIRNEVERLRNLHQMKYQQLDTNDNMNLVECGKRNLCNELLSFIDSLQEEPVSEKLEEAAKHYLYSNILYDDVYVGNPTDKDCIEMFKAGAQWQKEHSWKPADGDDLPETGREVVALLGNGKVVYAHRPPEYWDGKNIDTGKVIRYYPKTYDKGGWNIPDVVLWLDLDIPRL